MNTREPSSDEQPGKSTQRNPFRSLRILCKIGMIACLIMILLISGLGVYVVFFDFDKNFKSGELEASQQAPFTQVTSELLIDIGEPVSMSIPTFNFRSHDKTEVTRKETRVKTGETSSHVTVNESTTTEDLIRWRVMFGRHDSDDSEEASGYEIVDPRVSASGFMNLLIIIGSVGWFLAYIGLVIANLVILIQFLIHLSKESLFHENALRLVRRAWIAWTLLICIEPIGVYITNLVVSMGRAHIVVVPYTGLIFWFLIYLLMKVLAASIAMKQENDLTV